MKIWGEHIRVFIEAVLVFHCFEAQNIKILIFVTS